MLTLLLLVVQVRLQLQNVAASNTGLYLRKYRGSMQTIETIIREEGATAPFKACPLTPPARGTSGMATGQVQWMQQT